MNVIFQRDSKEKEKPNTSKKVLENPSYLQKRVGEACRRYCLLLRLYDLTDFDQMTHKEFSSCTVSGNDN